MIFSNGLSTASGPSVFVFGGRPCLNLVGLGVGAVALEADGVGRPVNAVVAVLTLGRLCDDDARERGHAPCPSPCGGLEPSWHAAPTPPVVVQEYDGLDLILPSLGPTDPQILIPTSLGIRATGANMIKITYLCGSVS